MAVERMGRPDGDPNLGLTIDSYFRSFTTVPDWEHLPRWPPDVFALANLVLDMTEAYRLAVAPPRGRQWPPTTAWNTQVAAAARQWRDVAGARTGALPELVRRAWAVVTRYREIPLSDLRPDDPWELWPALITLHALADEACAGLAAAPGSSSEPFDRHAWTLLAERGTLARISANRIRILPKTHFTVRGITMRSFSRYLALSFEAVDLHWRRIDAGAPVGTPTATPLGRDYHAILVPWPLRVSGDAFRPVAGPLRNMDQSAFGFFEFVPDAPLDLDLIRGLIAAARRKAPRIDAMILPESSVEPHEIAGLEAELADAGVTFLYAGVRQRPGEDGFGRNYIHLGVLTTEGWERFEQDKHHRWCLDGPQIRQYHLTRSLDPDRLWWEAIELPARMVQVLDLGGGTTTVPLVCEDLARMDEVMEILRRIGPAIIVALLLDGPQVAGRWPCRYASILAEEPGSAVLTLTSFGMAARSRPPGLRRSRVVGHWHDTAGGPHEIELARGASGVLLRASTRRRTVWTADGRRHVDGSPDLVLTGVDQLRVPRPSRA
jgi:hypothetical protein